LKRFVFASLIALAAATTAPAQMKPVAAAPSAPLPLAAFGKLPSIEGPAISTDGKMLAAKVRSGGAQYLALLPLDDPNAKPDLIAKDGEFDKRGDVRTIRWRWIDADNLLVWISAREDLDGQKYDAIRVIGYNRQTRKVTPLGWRGAFVNAGDVLWRSASGPPRILLARFTGRTGTERLFKPEVIEVDVVTGREKRVISPHPTVTDWYADGDGVVRMGTYFDRASGKLTALYRPDEKTNFRTIIREKTGKYDEAPVPLIFLPGDKALVRSRNSGFSEVYELDLNTMQLGRKIYGAKGYDVEAVAADRAGKALERITVVEDRERHIWFTPRLKEIQSVLDGSFGPGQAEIASIDAPAENIVVKVGGPDQAGAYYLFQTETGGLKRIGWANTELKDMKLNKVRTVRYRTGDGRTVSAVLTMPRLKGDKNLPLIVLPHGGPWARDSESWDMWAQPLAELGYAVIQPNFLGSSGFGKQWEAGSDGNWGNRMQDDLNDAVDHLAAQGVADPKRVCMFGWSYGGYAASRAAQRDGTRYRCAISGAGVHDLPEMVAYDRNYLGRYGSSYIGSAASQLADVSPARFAKQFSIPIMIVHGAKDDRVPVSQSRNLVARLKSAGKVEGRDFVYLEQPRNTHHLPLEEDRIQLLEEMKKFLAKHNPA
jgi:dipeptidyl aminopeptidase/acylaminoacyl peptidase